jgi:hypothetical protein
VANNKDIIPLQDGMFHAGKIRYKNNRLTVFLDGAEVLAYDVALADKLGLGENYYVGFTSSTSGSFAEHKICSWTISD